MKIILRPVTLEDGKRLVKWRNDEMILNHCFTRTKITEESNAKFYKDFIKSGKYKQFIVERVDEDFPIVSYPIATVYLKDMDYINKRCELCLFTSNDTEWTPESQSIAIKMLVEKAFNEYGMHKVYSYVFLRYLEEVELLKKAGFSSEAILKDEAINKNGCCEDIVKLCVIKSAI